MTAYHDEIIASLPARAVEVPLRWAQSTPDAPVVHTGPTNWSYRELAEGIEAFAAILAQAGARPGDRVVLAMENCFAALCAFYAITSIDAWAVMANARLSEREIAVIIERSDARFAVYTPEISANARTHAATAGAEIHEDPRFGVLAVALARSDATPEPIHDDPARQIAAMIFTSGSTGTPKGAMLSHRTIPLSGCDGRGRTFRAG